MHYHNATFFGYIRPSSGNTFMRSLMHYALIKYPYFIYVVFISFLEMQLFLYTENTKGHLMRTSRNKGEVS
jgi:hypothetical protein